MDACGIQSGVQAGSWRWKSGTPWIPKWNWDWSTFGFMRTWYHRLDLRYSTNIVWPVLKLQQYTVSISWWFTNRRVPSNPAPLFLSSAGCAGLSLTNASHSATYIIVGFICSFLLHPLLIPDDMIPPGDPQIVGCVWLVFVLPFAEFLSSFLGEIRSTSFLVAWKMYNTMVYWWLFLPLMVITIPLLQYHYEHVTICGWFTDLPMKHCHFRWQCWISRGYWFQLMTFGGSNGRFSRTLQDGFGG